MPKIIKILAVIFLAGLLMVALAASINYRRLNARDAYRVNKAAAIGRALSNYYKTSAIGYPVSSGECLTAVAGVGAELIAAKAISSIPTDPLWPTDSPRQITDGSAAEAAKNFCFYYYSGASEKFAISYFLESNSKAGAAGVNIISR